MINKHKVLIGDMFYIKYYGINVFLLVIETKGKKALVQELSSSKHRLDNGEVIEIISPRYKRSSSPKICDKSGSWFPYGYNYATKEEEVYVDISDTSPIYKEVEANGVLLPKIGTINALSLKEEKENGYLHYYFSCPSSTKLRKQNLYKPINYKNIKN